MNTVNHQGDPAVPLSTAERQLSAALARFGYTRREVAFIAMAAVYGRYFVKRQWVKFAGTANGRSTSEFLSVLLARGHVQAVPFGRRDTLYFIGSQTINAAIGRYRQPAQLFTVTRKLMALDVVLAFSERAWYGTEQEKVALFTGQFGLDEAILPARRQRSLRDPETPAIRHFREYWPIAVSGSTTTFTYVSHAERTTRPFERFLLDYAPLMSRLPGAVVLYVSGGGNWGAAAKTVFARHYPGAGQAPLPARLEAHFRSRRMFETGDISDFSAGEIDQLRSDLGRFRGLAYDRLYHRWQPHVDKVSTQSAEQRPPALETYHLPFTYPVAGSIEHPALTKRDRESS